MSDIYYTIDHPGKGIFREKMSRFLSFALPVQTADEARAILKQYQNEYHDARHVCWAWAFGPGRDQWQANDNGEPSGTAGKPILGQIKSIDVTDVIVIVVRYFGGIKLGTSGLIQAYREAARLALEDAGIKEMHESVVITICFPYLAMNDVMKVTKSDGIEVLNQQFDNSCEITLRIRKAISDAIISRLLDIDGVTEKE